MSDQWYKPSLLRVGQSMYVSMVSTIHSHVKLYYCQTKFSCATVKLIIYVFRDSHDGIFVRFNLYPYKLTISTSTVFHCNNGQVGDTPLKHVRLAVSDNHFCFLKIKSLIWLVRLILFFHLIQVTSLRLRVLILQVCVSKHSASAFWLASASVTFRTNLQSNSARRTRSPSHGPYYECENKANWSKHIEYADQQIRIKCCRKGSAA